MLERYVVVDLETTGHSVEQGDRIIQIGAIVIEGGEIIERFASYVNPQAPIPPFIRELTGISDAVVSDAPPFAELVPLLLPMLEQSYFVAHNAEFDLLFLQRQLENEGYQLHSLPVLDTVELSRILYPEQESYKLGDLAEQLDIAHERPHQADSDAEVTGLLFCCS